MNLPIASFDCDRTCPKYEKRDLCRFNRLFALMGVRTVVNSHTVTVAVEFRNQNQLAEAVRKMGGTVIGVGEHELYERDYSKEGNARKIKHVGFAFKLPGWSYPCIAQDDGTLAFDDYNGAWGNREDIETLKNEYSYGAAQAAAEQLGWMVEKSDEGLRVYHPSGGYLTVDSSGEIDACDFHGVGCHEATTQLAEAIGQPIQYTPKPEYFEQQAQIHVREQ